MNKKTTFLLLGSSILIFAYGIVTYSRSQKNVPRLILDPKIEDPKLNKDFKLNLIPDGKNNYRSAQILEKDLEYVIKKYGIKNIIRMNADGVDSRHKSSYPETKMATEKQICEKNGCKYHFINSHQGYQYNKGYVGSLNKIIPILNQGNTLIHCAHGADRTGGMVGGYLKNMGYMTDIDKLWDYTTQYNSWNYMISRGKFFGSGYDKYADAFYPIDLLKKKFR
jgi:protein tyrosine/serine phosphatase